MFSSLFVASHPQPRACGHALLVLGLLLAALQTVGCSKSAARGPSDFARAVQLPELDVSAKQRAGDCVIETQASHRAWGKPLGLSLSASGPRVASVFRVPARLHVRDDGVATLLVDDGLLTLRGFTALERVELFLRGPSYDRALFFSPLAMFEPIERTSNLLELRHRIRGPLRLPGDRIQELSLGCSQLSLSQGDFDPKLAAKLFGHIGYAYARSGQTLELWGSADAGSGMKLQVFLPKGEWIELTVHEHAGEGSSARWLVSYQQGTELVVGWVLRSELQTSPQPLGVVSYAAGVRFLVPESVGERTCKRDLAIGVVGHGVATRLGTLRAGANWDFEDPDDAEHLEEGSEPRRLVPIRVPHAVWLTLEPEQQLVVRSSELRACDEEPD